MNLDIEEGIAQFEKNAKAVLSLNRSKHNDRSRSLYASMANRGQDFKLDPNASRSDYFKLDGQYGEAWALTMKKNVLALPTARDIIDGLQDFYVEEIVKAKMTDSIRKGYQNEIISNYQKAFQKILELVDFKNPDEPMYYSLTEDGSKPDEGENNLMHPQSKATCLCYWLWTIEPSFYSWINQAAQEKDLHNLQYLGPMARAMSIVLSACEEERTDALPAGDDIL